MCLEAIRKRIEVIKKNFSGIQRDILQVIEELGVTIKERRETGDKNELNVKFIVVLASYSYIQMQK